jgi:hypothetical protein
MANGPLNYTTVIDPQKSAGECVAMLARHGVTALGQTFDGKGVPTGLTFQIMTPWGMRQYSLPINVTGTNAALAKAYSKRLIPLRYANLEQAQRVAWRVMRDWLEVQLALINAGVAELNQVMLPYMHADPGVTVYEKYVQNEQAALEPGNG